MKTKGNDMGFFSCVALILFAARVFGVSDMSYWLCFAPVLVDIVVSAGVIGAGMVLGKKKIGSPKSRLRL